MFKEGWLVSISIGICEELYFVILSLAGIRG